MAFVLREVQELITKEICKILEVSSTNLGVRLYRGRNRLRECLEKRGVRVHLRATMPNGRIQMEATMGCTSDSVLTRESAAAGIPGAVVFGIMLGMLITIGPEAVSRTRDLASGTHQGDCS